MAKHNTQIKEDIDVALKRIQEKKHVVKSEAVQAKKEFDRIKNDLIEKSEVVEDSDDDESDLQANTMYMDEINDNIQLLAAIFKKSNFEEYLYLLTYPGRLFVIQFINGFVRGIGFAMGILLIGSLFIFMLTEPLPSHFLINKIIGFLTSLPSPRI
ncbi:MAG: hypothetical protein HRT90_09035 [Candidatus Margulisbacteria bacterium]|nr:hypothetical protein [Candidatus Margulisiibacteriota bacterium]